MTPPRTPGHALPEPMQEPPEQRRARRRLLALLFAGVLGVLALALGAGHWLRMQTIHDEFTRFSAHIERSHAQDVQLSLALYQARARNLLHRPGVLAAVRAGERERLYRLLVAEYTQMREENPYMDVLHFHGADNVTLLRMHRPEVYGDDLSAVRPMIVAANRLRQPLAGFEIGKNGISYRVTVPIVDGDAFLGTLEIGIGIAHFSRRTARVFGVETGVILKRVAMAAYLAEHGETGLRPLGEYLAPRDLSGTLAEAFLTPAAANAPYSLVRINGEGHVLYRALGIRDYQGQDVGLLLVLDNVGPRLRRIDQYSWWVAVGMLSLFALLAWAFARAFTRLAAAAALDRARLDLAMRGAEEGFWDVDLLRREIYCSPRMRAMLGYAADEGPRSIDEWDALMTPEDLGRSREALTRHLAGETPQYQIEYRARHRAGHWVWLASRGQVVRDASGRAVRMLGLISEIGERKRMEEQIRHMAQHDALTGLANRALFFDLLRQTFANAKRDHSRFALLGVDLDDFKPVNDRHGHLVGDRVLSEVARRLRDAVRESDIVARVGGDEFMLLLRGVEDEAGAVAVAEKVRLALREPCPLDTLSARVTASIGVALFPDHGVDETTLLNHADIAMYWAKQHGQDRVCVYRPEYRLDAGAAPASPP